MSVNPGSEHPLDSPWPSFLDHLDDDQDGASAAFCEFAYRLLQNFRPRYFARIPADDREDAVQEILLHCIKDGCRVLRLYKPQGRPFAAWFLTVASMKAMDIEDRRKRDRERPLDEVPEPVLPNPGPHQGDPILRGKLLECLNGMGEKCRLLILLFCDGLKAAEIAVEAAALLGQANYSNRQASDDLRYCKAEMAKRLAAAGIRWP